MMMVEHPAQLQPQLAPPAMGGSSHMYSRRRTKAQICEHYIQRLRERGDLPMEQPGFVEGIRRHFDTLPTRYALDVNVDSLDVLSHKRLLDEARADPSAVSFAIRPVEIVVPRGERGPGGASTSFDSPASPQVHPVRLAEVSCHNLRVLPCQLALAALQRWRLGAGAGGKHAPRMSAPSHRRRPHARCPIGQGARRCQSRRLGRRPTCR